MQNNFNGIVPIYKEVGFTSNDVVAKLRGILHMRKIGHTGTLDPAAVGVLPVCLGRGTKLVSMLTDTDKTYRCTAVLGIMTDTEDLTGTVTEERDASKITKEQLIEAAESFIGDYSQIPPMYSAKKVDGKKLYELAREGRIIERKPCDVRILALDFVDIALPEFTFDVSCSKGTYIRSLCRDIGEKLGCGCAMKSLMRTRAAGFELKDAIKLEECERLMAEGTMEKRIVSLEEVFSELPKITVSGELEKKVRNGNSLRLKKPDGKYRVSFEDGTFAAVYEIKSGTARICGYFLT
ncbi:MAG: tRNA pseudouridine(55) synthase TruB [Lachnospiraceae bacterium]|nr:tRNA pseudouridine(55) synthase TruB [Lachnospiraceae bacterium]